MNNPLAKRIIRIALYLTFITFLFLNFKNRLNHLALADFECETCCGAGQACPIGEGECDPIDIDCWSCNCEWIEEGPTRPPTPTPTLIPCNGICFWNSRCQTGYCYDTGLLFKRCRNSQCPTIDTCVCPTPTPGGPTDTPVPTGTTVPTPTPTPRKTTISGVVFIDGDKDGQKDMNETTCYDGPVEIWIDSQDMGAFQSTSACNQYSYQVPAGDPHEIWIYPIPEGYTATGWSGTDENGQPISGSGSHAICGGGGH